MGFVEEIGRWVKTTHPGRFGMYAYVEHTLDKESQSFTRRLEYGRALPLQYLERLQLANEIFGDAIRLRSVVDCASGLSIETDQPDIEGWSPTEEGVAMFMLASGFGHVSGAGPTWYRTTDNVMVIDVQTWNFIETDRGDVLPFDIGILKPSGELLEYLLALN